MDFDNQNLQGIYGPNDYGYIHGKIVECAKNIKSAQELYSQGHYAHSNAKIIPEDHPLRIIMEQLNSLDQKYAKYANKKEDPELFSTYEPPIEDTTRWNNQEGVAGDNGDCIHPLRYLDFFNDETVTCTKCGKERFDPYTYIEEMNFNDKKKTKG